PVRARGPHLLPVDDEVITLVNGARAQACQVAAGAGLRETLTPSLVTGQDRLEVPLFLGLGAELDQRRTEGIEGAVTGPGRRMCGEILLVEDDLLDEAGAAAAIFLGPGDADPAGGIHLLLPGDAFVERLAVRCDARIRRVLDLEVVGQIGVEPGAEPA